MLLAIDVRGRWVIADMVAKCVGRDEPPVPLLRRPCHVCWIEPVIAQGTEFHETTLSGVSSRTCWQVRSRPISLRDGRYDVCLE